MISRAINDFKLGLKLIRYGFRPTMNLIMCILFVTIGFVVEICSGGETFLGIFYMLLSSVFAFQMIISMDISTMVQTSRMKRALQTSVPTISATLISLITYTVIVIERLILISINPENEKAYMGSLFMAIILMIITLVYTGVCYKYFVIATAVMMVSIYSMLFVAQFVGEIASNDFGWAVLLDIPGWAIIAFGYVSIAITSVITYYLCRFFYKAELSKFAFRGIFGKLE